MNDLNKEVFMRRDSTVQSHNFTITKNTGKLCTLLTSFGLSLMVKSEGMNSFSAGSCREGFSDTLFHS